MGGFDLDLDEILDLRILGTVGTKLDVAVDFNSTRELESKQLITAAYTGTEDEIVKKVEAGDIRVILPPSRFLGAGVARGTFGAQAVAQLGPVDLRFLGSRKEGQSTVRTLSIAPQGEGIEQEVTLDIKDTQFIDDRFFLLFHPDSLASQRLAYPNLGTGLANGQSTPTSGTLNVWLDDGNVTNNRENASKPGVARVDPTHPDTLPDQAHTGFFDLLVEGDDYVVTDQVIIQLKRQLDDTEVLAVSYLTQGGTQVGSEQGASELELKLIKPINPDTLDFTWDYTLRNVYSLREPDIQLTSLDLTIYRGNQDLKQTFESIDGESKKYVEIFGVSDANSRVNVPRILRDPFGGSDYLIFPSVRPFFEPVDESGAVIPLERPNRNLYFNADGSRTALEDQVYFVEATYLSQGGISGEVELGAANIIEGSEEITMGGQALARGTDYQIFYDFGRVVFSDPAGLAERASLALLLVVMTVSLPGTLRITQQAWNESVVLGCLLAAVALLLSGRAGLAVVPLALALATKQHVVLVLPLWALWPSFGWRRALAAGALAAAICLPWLLANPARFYGCTVEFFLDLPARPDSISVWRFLPEAARIPAVLGLVAGAYLLAHRFLDRSVASLVLACGLVFAAFDLANKQSFENQWLLACQLLVTGLACRAVEQFERPPVPPGELADPAGDPSASRPAT